MAAALVLVGLFAGCLSSSQETGDSSSVASTLSNVDLANTRNASSSIDDSTVWDLERVWSLSQHAKAEGLRYIASPVVADGVTYLQDPRSNVEAIDLKTGEVLWETRYEEPVSGPNGVVVASGLVFGATHTSAFALDAKSGNEVWSTRLVRNRFEQIAIAPGYHDGRVFFSTTSDKGKGDEVGVLWALEGKSGRRIWHFDTVPRSLWGHSEINYGGGLDFAPAFDGAGSLYVGVSNPGPIPGTPRYPWGSSHPGRNLYSNSIVKLDERTGKVEWYYQVVPHGVCTGALGPPVLTEAGGRKVVIGAGMQGIVVALDQKTGKLLWRRLVGTHNGHDNDSLRAMKGEFERLKTPMVVYPGLYGGVFGPLSLRGSTVFVPVVNGAVRVTSQTSLEAVGPYEGELVALDVATGEVEWKHGFPDPVFGPTTVTNDLVLASSLGGVTFALEAGSGKEVWREKLPGHTEGGMTLVGDTMLVRTGSPGLWGETPKLLAYRLPG